MKRDYTALTFDEMADDVAAMLSELKRRNPIGVNAYLGGFDQLYRDLREISEAEKDNPTCEAGPKQKRRRKK